MRIGVIQASSQAAKNQMIYDAVTKHAPTPKDAYLFAQINNGNAISLPLGEDYTWSGTENLEKTIEALFSEPFGQGYPKSEAERKIKDSEQLKEIRKVGQISMQEFLRKLDASMLDKVKKKRDEIISGTTRRSNQYE